MSPQDKYEDVYAYLVNRKWYCQDCVIQYHFYNKFSLFEKTMDNNVYHTATNFNMGIIHSGSVQDADFKADVPAKGIFCCKCGMECYAPDDTELRKHRFIFTEKVNRDNCTNHLAKMLDIDDSDVEDNEDTQEETPTYETICYTYEEIDDWTLERVCKQFSVSSYEVNSPVD